MGRQPRFSPDGNQIVYVNTDLNGNDDIWRVDLRTGIPQRLTDADEIDVTADWSRDGRMILFSSARGGRISVWTVSSSGGKRQRVNDGGYAPRFSPDGQEFLLLEGWSPLDEGTRSRGRPADCQGTGTHTGRLERDRGSRLPPDRTDPCGWAHRLCSRDPDMALV